MAAGAAPSGSSAGEQELKFVEITFAEEDAWLQQHYPLSPEPPVAAPREDSGKDGKEAEEAEVETFILEFRAPTAAHGDPPISMVFVRDGLDNETMRAARSAYVLYGAPGLAALRSAAPDEPDEASGPSPRFQNLFDVAEREIERIGADVCKAVAEAARLYALERLQAARGEVPREEARYRESPAAWVALGQAMVQLNAAFQASQPSQRRGQAARVIEGFYQRNEAPIPRSLQRQLGQLHDEASERQAILAAQVAGLGAASPVLYRVWNTPELISRIESALSSGAEAGRALGSIAELRALVFETLSRVQRASLRSELRFKSADGAEDVWRYRPLVNEALLRLSIPRGTVEWRAVQDKLAVSAANESPFSVLSSVTGWLDMGMAFIGSPPVVAVSSALALVAQAAEWLEQASTAKDDSDAFNCCLDPAQSFAAEPSFASLLVGIAFLFLQSRDTAGSVAKALHGAPLP
jgi:hypothetical protein